MHGWSCRKERKSTSCQNTNEMVKKREKPVSTWHGCSGRRRVKEGLSVLLGPVITFFVKFEIGDAVLGLNEAESWNEKPHEPGCLKGWSVVIRFSGKHSTCQREETRKHACTLAMGAIITLEILKSPFCALCKFGIKICYFHVLHETQTEKLICNWF